MIDLGLAIPLRIIDTIVDDPKSVFFWIDIHTSNDPNPFDHLFGIATPLPKRWSKGLGSLLEMSDVCPPLYRQTQCTHFLKEWDHCAHSPRLGEVWFVPLSNIDWVGHDSTLRCVLQNTFECSWFGSQVRTGNSRFVWSYGSSCHLLCPLSPFCVSPKLYTLHSWRSYFSV